MKSVPILLNLSGLIGSLIWLATEPDWEPLVTSVGLLASLIAQYYVGQGKNPGKTMMKQKGGKGSSNYQSHGDINITKNNL